MTADFPYARTLIKVQSIRGTKKKTGKPVMRYYLSSKPIEELTPEQWLKRIRDHWGGVENRNHWRRDACWMEDGTRSRKPNLVGALCLLRNALLHIIVSQAEIYPSMPAVLEAIAADQRLAWSLINR